MRNFGINLTGGGARGAYQAGVLLGLGEVLGEKKLLAEKNPFTVWSGISAGSINATFCAAGSENLAETSRQLVDLWANLTPNQVYKTNVLSLGTNSAKWIRDLTFGPLFKKKLAQNLLNTSPLTKLLEDNIHFPNIAHAIDKQYIHSLTCSAYDYRSAQTISFVQAETEKPWSRPKRRSKAEKIKAEHILASCSIPLLFPPTLIGGHYFGDGGYRNTAPLSPTIRMGAKKILMIGVRFLSASDEIKESADRPGVAKIAGSILNALFMDSLDLDIERLCLVNELIEASGGLIQTKRRKYTPVDFRVIRPSSNISKIAEQCSDEGFPKMIQYLLRGLGSSKETADLSSYILFEKSFTRQLIDLGYNDFMNEKQEILDWMGV